MKPEAEIKVPATTLAIIVAIFGAVFILCSYVSYQILYTLEWVSWAGVMTSFAVFACGLLLLSVGWIWLRVLRE